VVGEEDERKRERFGRRPRKRRRTGRATTPGAKRLKIVPFVEEEGTQPSIKKEDDGGDAGNEANTEPQPPTAATESCTASPNVAASLRPKRPHHLLVGLKRSVQTDTLGAG
jgi:hypothetical protein